MIRDGQPAAAVLAGDQLIDDGVADQFAQGVLQWPSAESGLESHLEQKLLDVPFADDLPTLLLGLPFQQFPEV